MVMWGNRRRARSRGRLFVPLLGRIFLDHVALCGTSTPLAPFFAMLFLWSEGSDIFLCAPGVAPLACSLPPSPPRPYHPSLSRLHSPLAIPPTHTLLSYPPITPSPSSPPPTPRVASKVCDLTGKKRNKANNVTFSGKRNRKWQNVNLQEKHIYWPEGQRLVKLKISTKAMRTIEKKGLAAMAKDAGIDLWKLPFEDRSPARIAYKAREGQQVPKAKNPRAMKNEEKLASSKKTPVLAKYAMGRIVYYREQDATLN